MSSPTIIRGPQVWDGMLEKSPENFTLDISKEDHAEIDQALSTFKKFELDGGCVRPDNFPLPSFIERFEKAKDVIHKGAGFFIIRGIDQTKFSVEDSVVVYLGIARHIGDRFGLQDRKGNLLCHVTDAKTWTVPHHLRHGIHSTKELPFHNDMGCDILCLQARQSAASGGYTYLASGATVFNDIATRSPEAIDTLFENGWPIQVLSEHQKAALEAVMESAKRNELRLRLNTGDILFVNNWAVLHRRDPYSDDDHTSRHLVRLWLRNNQMAWAIPQEMQVPWKAAYGRSEEEGSYSIYPMPEYKAPRYTAGSAAFVIEDSDDE
ncbi:unnamed protein product [Parascedosporium putredinis]|uniref:TauD/TfdA-like domain-containing protein n=1 Tax=Parascedosporium putredinis TaxID=1442378 RepID=A0A9P1GYY9_9PEZI|nr:unnamed protein product [Parascedosporium putredinis]CAI7991236.1 unnamed protein product [Parascedosporium putredinis]